MPAPIPETLHAAFADRYDLVRELGHGGMATVYLARDRKHDREVAVKVLRPELVTSLGGDRFLREIAITAHLSHPHVLTLIDSGKTDAGGFLYYVMPFVDGESLRDRLAREGALPIAQATRLLREVVDALAYAHQAGVVHRDIKPDNILLSGDHAVVVDFGIAKAVRYARDAESMTMTGTSIGTPAYMAPEQAAGDTATDHRADLYAVGVLAYEMLTGKPPFTGSPQSVLAAQIGDSPTPVAEMRADIPPALTRIVMRCLEKDPAARHQTAEALRGDLDLAVSPVRSRSYLVPALIGMAALVVITVLLVRSRRERQVHQHAIPTIQRLADAGETDSAFALAEEAAAILPSDSVLASLWPRFSRVQSFHSEPEGATITRARLTDTTRWIPMGTTPIERVRVPQSAWFYRFEKPGYRPTTIYSARVGGSNVPIPATVRLLQSDAPDSDMVLVAGGELAGTMAGLANVPSVRMGDFLIDRREVTNAQYKAFVDAGGYTKRDYWPTFARDGKQVPWDDGIALLKDRTGRPGPATWEGGAPPSGRDDFPVGGLSWYEAMAYARYAGKDIPTVYEWNAAAMISAAAWVVPSSNFESDNPMSVNASRGMSPRGVFDMAGNVREWCVNEDATGKRYILGGGWSDPSYMFTDAAAQPPIDRSPINGIRLIRRSGDTTSLASALRPIRQQIRDVSKAKPVSTAIFESMRAMYDYDHAPLHVRIESRDSSQDDWIREKVTFDAAYGGERVIAILFLPRHHAPPFQTVLYYPSSSAFALRSSNETPIQNIDYLVRSGRAVILPIFKGTYERGDGTDKGTHIETIAYRDYVLAWGKDLRRSVDYLHTRADIDTTRLAFAGTSWGGALGGIMMALEPRFRVGVLSVAGLELAPSRPEVDALNFLPHIQIPVLMLNAKYDHLVPTETSGLPFFRLLGSPPADKKYVLYEGGHFLPRPQMISESLNWLDKYLGPVAR